MKITKVKIENYKSIKTLEFKPSPKINVIIGENSVGKSNIIEAIYWLLGHSYPTFNATRTIDHYMGNTENKINISLDFDDMTNISLSEIWEDTYGNVRSGLNKHNKYYINNDERQRYCSAYLDVRRDIVDYLPSNRWSLLGRFLQDVNKIFMEEKTSEDKLKSEILTERLTQIRDELLFSVQDEEGNRILPEFLNHVSDECAKQLNRNPEEFKLDMNLYDPWNFYKTLQILVTDPEIGLEFQASEMGMGVQASLSIAILKAYSKLKLANNTPIFIDEPELFLHPQAQRNFYNILKELADSGTQIFLTTHSPAFIDLSHFNQIILVRKDQDRGTYVNMANTQNLCRLLSPNPDNPLSENQLMEMYEYKYNYTGNTQKANEGFFASKIILVEGASDALIIPYLFDLIGFNYIAENISIVSCGSKNAIATFYHLYSEFGIPCYIIFDGDRGNNGKTETETIKRNKDILSLFGEVDLEYPDGTPQKNYLGFTGCLEDNLGPGIKPDKKSKGLDLYVKVREIIRDKTDVPKWVTDVYSKLLELPR